MNASMEILSFERAFAEQFATAEPVRINATDVGSVVIKHALAIGCTDSNATAAVAWGLRVGYDTLSAIRFGKARAETLRHRQLRTDPTFA